MTGFQELLAAEQRSRDALNAEQQKPPPQHMKRAGPGPHTEKQHAVVKAFKWVSHRCAPSC